MEASPPVGESIPAQTVRLDAGGETAVWDGGTSRDRQTAITGGLAKATGTAPVACGGDTTPSQSGPSQTAGSRLGQPTYRLAVTEGQEEHAGLSREEERDHHLFLVLLASI
jgi:hypothetical protein